MVNDVSYFLTVGAVLRGLLLLTALWIVATQLASRRGWRIGRIEALLLVAPLALILAPTLLRGAFGFDPSGVIEWSDQGWYRLSYSPYSTQALLNAALFVPAGVVWAFAFKSLVRVTGGVIALSLVVECLQGLTATGVPDPADLITNSVGGTCGAVLGYASSVAVMAARGKGVEIRSLGARIGGVLVVALCLTTTAQLGADRRQRDLVNRLHTLYGHSSLEQYDAWQSDDASGGLYTHVFRPDVLGRWRGVDGSTTAAHSVSQRYPASFFGVDRCVFVTWMPRRTLIAPASGERCSRPLIS